MKMKNASKLKKFKKAVILDTVIFYPEHRALLDSLCEEVKEYPSSLPERLEQQYEENPELFLNKKCYTQIAADNTPLQLLMNRIEGAEVVISCWTDIPDEIIRLNPQLKLIVFWTHEKEHRINMRLADELGITVTNVPDYGTDSVTEVVFAGLWALLLRNHPATEAHTWNANTVMHAVMNEVFERFRLLPNNEKYTRSGKFTHHFHKLGLTAFNFTEKNLEELIPERLIEHKHVGLWHVPHGEKAMQALKTFGVVAQQHASQEYDAAHFYKFLAENEYVFYDASHVSTIALEKAKKMFGEKLIAIESLETADYAFEKKTFGVIGLGRIGYRVAVIAKALGFDVAYYSSSRKTEAEKTLGIVYKPLDELVRTSNVLSVHVPAHKAEYLISTDLIEQMPNGTIFINTADGNAVDQPALTKRMQKNEIFAYLDVYPGLPRKDVMGMPMEDKSDWKIHKLLPNNVIAYRAGWKTQESIRIKTYKLLGSMLDYLLGQKDPYQIPKEL